MFAGAGGANNLVQSNWIREKGFGMGAYVPKIESPVTGEPEPAPTTGSMVRQDEENIGRFNGWFKVANKEQLVSFWAICLASIIVFSVLAYSTVYGKNLSDEADFDFIKGEGEVLKDVVAPWFGTFFWIFGSISLVLVALGVVDYVARLSPTCSRPCTCATTSAGASPRSTRASCGRCACSASPCWPSGFDQPLVLLVLSALPERDRDVHLLDPADQAQPQSGCRRRSACAACGSACSCFAVLFYGFFAGWYVIVQMGEIF